MSSAVRLEDATLPFITSIGPMTIADLAKLMLRSSRLDYQFDAAGSDARVNVQAVGLAWEGPLLKNLQALAAVSGLMLVVDENFIRLIKEEKR